MLPVLARVETELLEAMVYTGERGSRYIDRKRTHREVVARVAGIVSN